MYSPSRETQLRAFYSTTEEISVLFAKQQEQLKAMQRTLEDEENYENTSVDIDLNLIANNGIVNGTLVGEKEASGYRSNSAVKVGSGPSAHRRDRNQAETSSDEASATEKHDCDIRSQEDDQDTQEADFTSPQNFVTGGFGSDIDGVGTAPVQEGDPNETERVLETESPGVDGDRNIDLSKCSQLAGDTMQLDDETHVKEAVDRHQMIPGEISHHSQSNNPLEIQNTLEDTEAGDTIRTADLLASEVVGSWACSTAPSDHGENESPRSQDNDEEGVRALHDSNAQVSESQIAPSAEAITAKRGNDRQALSEMIGIIAPDRKQEFAGAVDDDRDQEEVKKGFVSNSDTEDCTDNDDDDDDDDDGVNRKGEDCTDNDDDDDDDDGVNRKGEARSDAEMERSDKVGENGRPDDAMDVDDDEATQEDSVG